MYSDNLNHQVLISLLKEHGIKQVIVSPGGTNPALVASFQSDNFFILHSCVDERSAAYMACGLSSEIDEPIIICCTGATASRNYFPGLTEARYRKIPIIAITCSRPSYYIGHLMPQVTDRINFLSDIFVDSEQIQIIKDELDFKTCEYRVNKAILESKRHGGGPVHLNVECVDQRCSTIELPKVHKISRIMPYDAFPPLERGRIAIFVGSHKRMTKELTEAMELFCEKYNAVILVDHTSGYYGKYRIHYSLFGTQTLHKYPLKDLSLLIHIGEVSGDYHTMWSVKTDTVWRVNEDGEIRIRFDNLDYVFEMPELLFFKYYNKIGRDQNSSLSFYEELSENYEELYNKIPSLGLSHIGIAKCIHKEMPKGCVIHFAILNALRSWNFFRLDNSIRTSCNVGGFGIDGCTSTLIGASLANLNTIYYCITGDLAFFYDLNSLGNRHIRNNIRILLINDNGGTEFRHFQCPVLNVDVDSYIAGKGHFGNGSKTFVKDIAINLGFDYYQVSSFEDFNEVKKIFLQDGLTDKPILVEVFTTAKSQSDSWESMSKLESRRLKDYADMAKKAKNMGIGKIVKKIL